MMEIIKERLDISYIAKKTEQIELLSKTMVRPYQLTILRHFTEENHRIVKKQLEIPFEAAKTTLLKEVRLNTADLYQQKVNKIIQIQASKFESLTKGLDNGLDGKSPMRSM